MSTLQGGAGGIVTDGLVLHLDAANYKSYTSGSIYWNDLTINSINAVTASNVTKPVYSSFAGGSVYFQSVAGAGNTDAPTMTLYNSKLKLIDSFAVEIWFRPELIYTDFQSILRAGLGTDQMYGIFYNRTSPVESLTYAWYDSAFKSVASPTLPISKTFGNHIVMSKNQTNLEMYFNGTFSTSSVITNTSVTNYGALDIGNNRGSSGQKYSGDISIVRIYNRALSAYEILQNYNSSKKRFGL